MPHRVLIGTPLILVLLFAFGFVLINPAQAGQSRSAASQSVSQNSKKTVSDASPTPLAPTALPTLSPVLATGSSDPAAVVPAGTTTPQATGPTSPVSTSRLQSAVSGGQSISPSQPITTRQTLPTTILTNLLHF